MFLPVVLPRYDLHCATPFPVLALRDQLIVGVVPADPGGGVRGGMNDPLDDLIASGRFLQNGHSVLPDPQKALVPFVNPFGKIKGTFKKLVKVYR